MNFVKNMKVGPRRLAGIMAMVAGFASLSACGGSGSITAAAPPVVTMDPPSTAPTLVLSPQSIKNFRFTWTDVADETEYRLLEDPTGSSGYSPAARIDANTSAHDLEVFLPARINARYIMQACNAGGCVDSAPVAVEGNLATAIGYVKTSNSGNSDRAGTAIAISSDGQTLAVSATGEDSISGGVKDNADLGDNIGYDTGAVYIFAKSNGLWSQQAFLKATNPVEDGQFGMSLSFSTSGDVLAVGAPGDPSSAGGINNPAVNDAAGFSGAVFVFARNAGVWALDAHIKTSFPTIEAVFGQSVALSSDGTTLVAGAPNEGGASIGVGGNETLQGIPGAGAVYAFERSVAGWVQTAYVKANFPDVEDYFGLSVDISADGNLIAVGALNEDGSSYGVNGNQAGNGSQDRGAVFLLARNANGDWEHQAYLKPSNGADHDQFGHSVSLSGDGLTLAVGAVRESNSASGVNGLQSQGALNHSGAVYVFRMDSGQWAQEAYVKASNPELNDSFGHVVDLSFDGSVLAVATPYQRSTSEGINGGQGVASSLEVGAVYMFRRSADAWSQFAFVKAPNPGHEYLFGYSASISSDASVMAVGSPGERSLARGIGGSQSAGGSAVGTAYLY